MSLCEPFDKNRDIVQFQREPFQERAVISTLSSQSFKGCRRCDADTNRRPRGRQQNPPNTPVWGATAQDDADGRRRRRRLHKKAPNTPVRRATAQDDAAGRRRLQKAPNTPIRRATAKDI